MVMRTDIGELHPDSLSAFRPPHDSVCCNSGQFRRLTKDQAKLSTDGKHFIRTEAEPRVAQICSIHNVGGCPFRQGDTQRCADPLSWLFFIYGSGHSLL
jgi:hypothetical protein